MNVMSYIMLPIQTPQDVFTVRTESSLQAVSGPVQEFHLRMPSNLRLLVFVQRSWPTGVDHARHATDGSHHAVCGSRPRNAACVSAVMYRER